MAESKFALRMLEKQGWKEGDGLGKNKDGISKPIKAFMKRDKAGVGQDLGADLTDHWWMRVFNDAAKANVTKTNEQEVKEAATATIQNRLYAGFRKGSTLKQGKEEKDSDCSSEEDEEKNVNSSNLPTLNDIHKYCGGATGHRAATLGIKMTGKLKRAAEHERLFDERIKVKTDASPNDEDQSSEVSCTTETSVKREKKRKKEESFGTLRGGEILDETVNDRVDCDKTNGTRDEMIENIETERVKRKKNKKSKRKGVEKYGEQIDPSEDELEDIKKVKKRKKSKSESNDNEFNHSILEDPSEEDIKKVKKRKKCKSRDNEFNHSILEDTVESLETDKPKKHKRTREKKHNMD